MIQGGQVVDTRRHPRRRRSDFTRSLVAADDLRGQAVRRPAGHRHAAARLPQVACSTGRRGHAADNHRRADRRRQEADHRQGQGPLRSATTAASGCWAARCCGRPAPTTSRDDNTVGFDDRRGADGARPAARAVHQRRLLLGAPADWSDPSALTQGLRAMQWTGLWTFPDIKKALGDDFGVCRGRALDGQGKPSVPVGAYGSCVSAKSKQRRRRQGVRQVAVGRPDRRPARLRAVPTASTSRPAEPRRPGATSSRRPAADAVKLATEYGHAQTPLLWTPEVRHRVRRRVNRIVKDGADPRPRSPRSKTDDRRRAQAGPEADAGRPVATGAATRPAPPG